MHRDDHRPRRNAFGLVHAVTPLAASRALLQYVPDLGVEDVYAGAWRTGAAILVGFTSACPPAAGQLAIDTDPRRPEELVAQAVDNGDAHVIKFTEACLREHALNPNPVYLLAANELLQRARGDDEPAT